VALIPLVGLACDRGLTCERKNSKASKEWFLQVLQTADKSTQKDWTGVDFVLFGGSLPH
jgi:hypothetical protein